MSEPTWAFMYKCRRCGEIERNPRTNNQNATLVLVSVVIGAHPPKDIIGVMPEMLSIHVCKDGGHGVADLIGIEEMKE